MGKIKDINIKNKTYYFYDEKSNIKDFDSSLLKLDKKSIKNILLFITLDIPQNKINTKLIV